MVIEYIDYIRGGIESWEETIEEYESVIHAKVVPFEKLHLIKDMKEIVAHGKEELKHLRAVLRELESEQ